MFRHNHLLANGMAKEGATTWKKGILMSMSSSRPHSRLWEEPVSRIIMHNIWRPPPVERFSTASRDFIIIMCRLVCFRMSFLFVAFLVLVVLQQWEYTSHGIMFFHYHHCERKRQCAKQGWTSSRYIVMSLYTYTFQHLRHDWVVLCAERASQ